MVQSNAGTGTMVADALQYRVSQVVPTLTLDVEDYQNVLPKHPQSFRFGLTVTWTR